MTNELTTKIIILDDGTKVLQRFRSIVSPNGIKQIQASQPVTSDTLKKQIDLLQADLNLLEE